MAVAAGQERETVFLAFGDDERDTWRGAGVGCHCTDDEWVDAVDVIWWRRQVLVGQAVLTEHLGIDGTVFHVDDIAIHPVYVADAVVWLACDDAQGGHASGGFGCGEWQMLLTEIIYHGLAVGQRNEVGTRLGWQCMIVVGYGETIVGLYRCMLPAIGSMA